MNLCNGCKYHNGFPYKARPPLAKASEQVFESEDDVYDVIRILIEEVEEMNQKGKKFDVAVSVAKQLPFFVCVNLLMKKEYQKAIEKYVFCNETSTPAYKGDYGDQPFKWVQMYFILKQAFALQQKQQIDKAKNGS